MKKLFIIGLLAIAVQSVGFAQWTPTGAVGSTTIYNTNTTGSVGIGISSPTVPYQKLHVNGNIHIPIGNSLGWNQAQNFTYNGQSIGRYSLGWYSESGAAVANLAAESGIRFFTSATERMFITSDGKVGIGTTSPASGLEVQSANGGIHISDFGSSNYLQVGGRNISTGKGFVFKSSTNQTSATQLSILVTDGTNQQERLTISNTGNVGIGTNDTKGYKLGVNGSAIATSMTVKLYANWPDFVFAKTYGLRSLAEVESFIKVNSHLPEVPSAAQVAKDGINLGEMDATLLKKIEELTLYLIEQNKQLQELKKVNEVLQKEVQALKK
jgi:hypothetical protein